MRERLAALARAHPEDRFTVVYDQADLVQEAIASVRDSIAVGLLLAVATLFFFIADLRATAVAAAVIPATVLISCLVLRALDLSFNLMTLGGIAAGIGLILDDAIVVIENVSRHRAAGEARRRGRARVARRDHPRAARLDPDPGRRAAAARRCSAACRAPSSSPWR